MEKLVKILPIVGVSLLMSLANAGLGGSVATLWAPLFLAAAVWAVLIPAMKNALASPIDLTLGAYLGVWGLAAGLLPPVGRFIHSYPGPLLYLLLLASASLPQLLGRAPFTTYFAKKRTAAHAQDNPIFRQINLIMSWTWAGIFFTQGLISLAPHIWAMPLGWRLFCQIGMPLILLLGLGVPFTARYPDYHQRKLGINPDEHRPESQPQSPEPSAPHPETSPSHQAGRPKENTMFDKPTVVAISGSPHGAIGNTDMMIEMLRPGLESQGFDLELINLTTLDIGYCVGCALCLEKGACWQHDDHSQVMEKLLAADGVVFGSPVYFRQVTGQMKTFIDRALAFGHKPRGTWKPGLAVSVSAGMGEVSVAEYLAGVMRLAGAFPVGRFTAMATSPGGFMGKELVEQRADELAERLALAIKEKRRYPASENDLYFWLFIGHLVQQEKDLMTDDYQHWQGLDLFDSFESYVQQKTSQAPFDPEMRKTWLKDIIAQRKQAGSAAPAGEGQEAPQPQKASGPKGAKTCRELLEMMPLGFDPAQAGDLQAVIQFKVEGDEDFSAYLNISNGSCSLEEGNAPKASLTITTPGETWLGIAQGKIDGQGAFMSGQYKAEGDLGLLLRMSKLFGKR